MTDAIAQHVVPRMYLENWVDKKGHVWTYFKNSGQRRNGIPDRTAIQRHFYTVQNDDGTRSWQVENLLSSIEGGAKAPLLELAATGYVGGKEDRENIAAFVASMIYRTSPMRTVNARRHAWWVENEMRKLASNDEDFWPALRRLEADQQRSLNDEEIQKVRAAMVDSSGYKFEVPKEIPIEIMLRAIEENISTFAAMHWATAWIDTGTLITSDNAVLQFTSPDVERPTLMHPDSFFTLPLNPHCLLVMAWHSPPKRRFELAAPALERENHFRIIQAENEIYANKNDETLAAKIAELRDVPPFVNPMHGDLKSEVVVTRRLRKADKDNASS